MEIRLIRHATLVVRLGGRTLLVDPMLTRRGPCPRSRTPPTISEPPDPTPRPGAYQRGSGRRDLYSPGPFDEAATERLPGDLPLLCQPEDEKKLRSSGFSDVRPVVDRYSWENVELVRTGGRHGTGEIGALMAPVSGFVLRTPDEPALYVAGDTIWCPEVESALAEHRPEVTVVNAGAARFTTGDPITMTAADIAEVSRRAPYTAVVAVHMEEINHCLLTRDELRKVLDGQNLPQNVFIPADGERMEF